MCEAVEKYAKEYAKEYAAECVIGEKIISARKIIKNMKLNLEQALDVLEIQGAEREQIIKQFSE